MYLKATSLQEIKTLPVVGLLLVSACCWTSGLLSLMPLWTSVPPLIRSLVSKVLLSSSASAVACTRGGRPGGSVTGKAGMGLEVRVTGTTATGDSGDSAAAIGTSGLTSDDKDSGGETSLYVRADTWGWSAAGGRREGSQATVSTSLPESARPFKAFRTGNGEAAKDRGESVRDLSVLGIWGVTRDGLLSPIEEEGEEAEEVDSLAEEHSLVLATVFGKVTVAVSEVMKGSSGLTEARGSDTGTLASSLSNGASGCTSTGEEDFWTTCSNFGISTEKRKTETNGFKFHKTKSK